MYKSSVWVVMEVLWVSGGNESGDCYGETCWRRDEN